MKKARIKQKASELFMLYGIRSVTMEEISAQLGVSKKTIYQFFNDKSDLVDEVVSDILENNAEICSSCKAEAQNAVDEAFRAIEVIDQILSEMNPAILFDLERGYPKSFEKFHEFKYNFLYGTILENIRRGKAGGLYRQEIEEEIYAMARIEMIQSSLKNQLFSGKYSTMRIQKEMMLLFLYSMATPKGVLVIEKHLKKKPLKPVNPTQ